MVHVHSISIPLEGSILMQVKGGKEVTLTPGQTFYEGPMIMAMWSDSGPCSAVSTTNTGSKRGPRERDSVQTEFSGTTGQ